MNKVATFVKKLEGSGYAGDVRVYDLSEPLEGHSRVAVSAVDLPPFLETYIFPLDEDGEMDTSNDLDGSFRGEVNHEKALNYAGYAVQESLV